MNKSVVEMAHFRMTIAHGNYHRRMQCRRFSEEDTEYRLTFTPSNLAKRFVIPNSICRYCNDGLMWTSMTESPRDQVSRDASFPYFTINLETSKRVFGFETLRRNASEDSLCVVGEIKQRSSSADRKTPTKALNLSDKISVSSAGSSGSSVAAMITSSTSNSATSSSATSPRPSTGAGVFGSTFSAGDPEVWIPLAIVRTPPSTKSPPASPAASAVYPLDGNGKSAIWNFTRSSFTDEDLKDDDEELNMLPVSSRFGTWLVQRILFHKPDQSLQQLEALRKECGDTVEVTWVPVSPRTKDAHIIRRVGEFKVTNDKISIVCTFELEELLEKQQEEYMQCRVLLTSILLIVAKDSPAAGVFALSSKMLEEERHAGNETMTPRTKPVNPLIDPRETVATLRRRSFGDK